MKTITIAGNLGRDAEHKTTSNSEFCSFSVAVDDGWGDNKTTMWFDVTRWGKGADGLARTLRKGSKVAVSGDLTTREHNGKTYLQVRADKVTIQSTPGTGQSQASNQGGPNNSFPTDGQHGADLDDDIPF